MGFYEKFDWSAEKNIDLAGYRKAKSEFETKKKKREELRKFFEENQRKSASFRAEAAKKENEFFPRLQRAASTLPGTAAAGMAGLNRFARPLLTSTTDASLKVAEKIGGKSFVGSEAKRAREELRKFNESQKEKERNIISTTPNGGAVAGGAEFGANLFTYGGMGKAVGGVVGMSGGFAGAAGRNIIPDLVVGQTGFEKDNVVRPDQVKSADLYTKLGIKSNPKISDATDKAIAFMSTRQGQASIDILAGLIGAKFETGAIAKQIREKGISDLLTNISGKEYINQTETFARALDQIKSTTTPQEYKQVLDIIKNGDKTVDDVIELASSGKPVVELRTDATPQLALPEGNRGVMVEPSVGKVDVGMDVYHGTSKTRESLIRKEGFKDNAFFSTSEGNAKIYAGVFDEDARVIKANVNLKKPIEVDVGGSYYTDIDPSSEIFYPDGTSHMITDLFGTEPGKLKGLTTEDVVEKLKSLNEGDGVVFKNILDPEKDDIVVAFTKDSISLSQPTIGAKGIETGEKFGTASVPRLDVSQKIPTSEIENFIKTANKEVVANAEQIKTAGTFLDSVRTWANSNNVAKTRAMQYIEQFDVPKGLESEVADGLRGLKVSPAAQPTVDAIRKGLDDLFVEIQKVNPNVKYREDFLPQFWETDAKFTGRSISLDPASAKARTMTYDEAIAAGFKPKYENPLQFVAEYYENLQKAKNGQALFEYLKESGTVLDSKAAKNQTGLVRITAENFPAPVVGNYYATPKTAAMLNNMFKNVEWDSLNNVEKAMRAGSKFSGGVQDIVLSGGVGPINSFTISNAIKEEMSGLGSIVKGTVTLNPSEVATGLKRMGSPFQSVAFSLTRKGTIKRFVKYADDIVEMQERGIPVSSSMNIKTTLGSNKWIDKNMSGWGNTKAVWARMVNEPTFQRLMPNLQLNLFRDVKGQLLKEGFSAKEAADIAAENVKNFYGLKDIGKSVSQSQLGKDTIGSIFFAPRYREGMINFWGKDLKGLYEPLKELSKMDPKAARVAYKEYQSNLSFMIGLGITYASFNALNYKLNGRSMRDNPEGKQDKLLIPIKGDKVIAIPLIGSVATMPKLAISATGKALKRDFPGVVNDAKSTLSMPLRTGIDLATNKNFFGKDIYDPEIDTAGEQATKMGAYTLSQNSHPVFKAIIKYMNGEKLDAVFEALEAPISVYDKSSIDSAGIYAEFDRVKKDTGITSLDPNAVKNSSNPNRPIIDKLISRLYDSNGKEKTTIPESQRTAIKKYLAEYGVDVNMVRAENKSANRVANKQEQSEVKSLSKEEQDLYNATKANRALMLKEKKKKLSDYPRLKELLLKYGEERESSSYSDYTLDAVKYLTGQGE